jgi:chaperonin GroES
MKKLNPANDRVVVKPIEEDEQLYGNIIVPDMGKERPEMGEVIAAGPGRMSEFGKHIPVKAKVGQVVLVPKIGSIRVELEGQEFYIVQDREILAIVEEDIEVEEI